MTLVDIIVLLAVKLLTFLGMIVVGAAVVPVVVYLLDSATPNFIARKLFTNALRSFPAAIVHQNADKSYDILPATSRDGRIVATTGPHVEGSPDRLALLAKVPIGLSWEKTGERIRRYASSSEAIPDGGDIPIKMSRVQRHLDGAGGSAIADRAEREGLADYGGKKELGNVALAILVFLALVVGAGTGVVLVS